MRVIAAVYSSETAANEVAFELKRRHGLGPAELRIAPFGPLGPDEEDELTIPSEATIILAGRLHERIVEGAEAIIVAHGGLIVSDVDATHTGWTAEGTGISVSRDLRPSSGATARAPSR